MESLLLWRLVLVSLALLAEELPLLLWPALLLALVVLPLLASLASPVALDSQVVEVLPLLDSLETSLPLQLDSPETLSSRLPASTLAVPLLLGSSPLREDRLCRRWIPRVNLMV